jgi:1,2-phenylacetyl-CoA epoxidase catalytic subunit
MKLYLITGETGEYSDYDNWNVSITDSEDVAKEFVESMNEETKQVGNLSWGERDEIVERLSSKDPKIRIDYTGTTYSYEEFELNEF